MNRKPFEVQYRREGIVNPVQKWAVHSRHSCRKKADKAIEDQQLIRPGFYEMRIRGRGNK